MIFANGYSFLSNYKNARFTVDKISFRNVEQFRMANKADFFGRDDLKAEVMSLYSPRKCFEVMECVGTDERWEALDPKIVERGVTAKFKPKSAFCT